MTTPLSDADREAINKIWTSRAGRSCKDIIEGIWHLGFAAGRAAALEEAATKCEQLWRDGYRGEVNSGFAHVCRSLATKEG